MNRGGRRRLCKEDRFQILHLVHFPNDPSQCLNFHCPVCKFHPNLDLAFHRHRYLYRHAQHNLPRPGQHALRLRR
ncbi:hypothetical protein ACKS0A_09797 [Histoplasma ohiense]